MEENLSARKANKSQKKTVGTNLRISKLRRKKEKQAAHKDVILSRRSHEQLADEEWLPNYRKQQEEKQCKWG